MQLTNDQRFSISKQTTVSKGQTLIVDASKCVCVCPLTRLSSLGSRLDLECPWPWPCTTYTPYAFICTYQQMPAIAGRRTIIRKKIREGEKSCINNKDAYSEKYASFLLLHCLFSVYLFCCRPTPMKRNSNEERCSRCTFSSVSAQHNINNKKNWDIKKQLFTNWIIIYQAGLICFLVERRVSALQAKKIVSVFKFSAQ